MANQTTSQVAISPREKELYGTMRALDNNENLKTFLEYIGGEIKLTPVYRYLEQDGTIPTSREVILGGKLYLKGSRIEGAYLDFFQIFMASSGIGCQGQHVLAPNNSYSFGYGMLHEDRTGYFYAKDEGRTDYVGKIFPRLTGAGVLDKVTRYLKNNNAILTDKLDDAEKLQRQLEQMIRTGRKLEAKYRR